MQTALLLQMLAARQGGGSGNGNVTELLARMQSGGLGAPASVSDMMQQLAQRNPMLGQILQQLGHRGSGEAADDPSVVEGEAVEVPTALPEGSRSLQVLPSDPQEVDPRHETLVAELNVMRERVDRCAAALGACGACWGTDPGCRACRGRGWPGFSMPDEVLFEELIVPAIRMMRTQRATRPASNELKTAVSGA
jgi:hypothetical protein